MSALEGIHYVRPPELKFNLKKETKNYSFLCTGTVCASYDGVNPQGGGLHPPTRHPGWEAAAVGVYTFI